MEELNFREYLMFGFRQSIGKKEDGDIILSSAEWCYRGKLLTEDLAEIKTAIDNKNAKVEPETVTE